MKKILMFIILAFLLSGNPFKAQDLNSKKAEEHASVKELLMSMGLPSELAQLQTPSDKYSNDWKMSKINALKDRKSYIMNGNKITASVYNYGGIGPGGANIARDIDNVVWRNLGYVYQFCPFVAASVPSANDPTKRLKIVSDALNDYSGLYEVNPADPTDLWQWEPLEGYADPDQDQMASNPADDVDGDGKPDSWPRSWYNPTIGKYVWPGFLSQGSTNADQEVFWAMDDRDNREFPYYPYVSDTTKRGIGVQVDGRAFQWSNALAENAIFFVYTITNVSEKDLDSVIFGIYGDPDIGGGAPENTDDYGYFVPPYSLPGVDVSKVPVYARSMVYFYDRDKTGPRNLPLGYLGCKFLESPGDADNGIDDDGDGLVDERQDDGIDNDGDWNPDLHDVGVDGVAKTNDEGEGDGFPTRGLRNPDGSPHPLYPGEPNFEFTDLDESDQIGLTSFNSWQWREGGRISDDEIMWNRATPRNFSEIQGGRDIVFIFGAGYISLKKGETKRISMALLLGEDLDDLLTTAETVQRIYNENYQFFKPPVTPTLTAVPDDKKVTLFWDAVAEESVDPITGKDFEGYVIYRSVDPDFNDILNITDGKGSGFLLEPLQRPDGTEAKWDLDIVSEPFIDKNNNGRWDTGESYQDWNKDGKYSSNIESLWKGYHPIPYQGRGLQYYLGNNSGLVHSFVDSNNVLNGQTYYYALVAYDHGDSVGIPPTETSKKITADPITGNLKFDKNTAQVIPGPRASGYIEPEIQNENLSHTEGIGTGDIQFEILNDLSVVENGQYEIQFYETLLVEGTIRNTKNYSVLNLNPIHESFSLYDTNFTQLGKVNISDDSYLEVSDAGGTIYTETADYVINYERGAIRRTRAGQMTDDQRYNITYRYYPIIGSTALKNQDYNNTFDGIKLFVMDQPILEYDSVKSKWIEGNTNLAFDVRDSKVLPKQKRYPADYLIEFSSQNIDSALSLSRKGVLKVPVKYKVNYRDTNSDIYNRVMTVFSEKPSSEDSVWTIGEEISIFKPGSKGVATDTITWAVSFGPPEDSSVTMIPPGDGDVFFLATARPYTNDDKFVLSTQAGRINTDLAKNKMENIYVVPNPYVGYSIIEPANKLPNSTRGERRIYFENLPSTCTIRIYSLSGNHVATLDHDSGNDNGREFWNLLNKDGFSVAYGIYFAHIDAPGVGEKIIKFALIK